ncbi:Universal stress protein [Thauera humireducens]|jgi:nucleotide-binding universal stress UspA family protein|uniref:universal stress protein n=1 Tax=Thauera humireducens TaxID=1134435 RepID=UPI002467A5ED|nr:universal stress protein [Thauera humireducens]CAH1746022.1 Universal stress protein [Thauera humireducens]
MYKHILIPIDGSDMSTDAARRALDFAKIHGARATVLYVLTDSAVAAGLGKSTRDEAARTEMAQGFLRPIGALARQAGVEAECFYVESDSPADEIVETARKRGCDLIHMASHARRGVVELLLGSVTADVLKRTSVPVLVVR